MDGGGGSAPGGDLAAAARALAGTAESGGIEAMQVDAIVAAYYQALSVRAHSEAAGAEGGGQGAEDAKAALDAFDRRFHPRAMARLESVAAGLAERLEREMGDGGEVDGGEFDRLRAAMSAAEFARQYDRGLRGG